MIGPMLNRKGSAMDLLGHGLGPCPVRGGGGGGGRYTYMDGVND